MTLLATAAAVLAAVLVLVWAAQRSLMYFPVQRVPPPDAVGLADAKTVTYETADGLALTAWWVPADVLPPRATILVFNGNAGSRAYRAPLAAVLRRHGFQVLLTDYRGYGGNPGTPTETGLAADSRAARAYVAARADVDPSRLVYFGESLGTGVAVDLAVEHPPAALILRSPFTSMADVGGYHYPLLPVRWFLKDQYASLARIARIRVPLLVIAGERDRIVPLEYSRQLYEAASGPKSLHVIADADHNDYDLLAGESMIAAIVQFLARIGLGET